MVQAEQGDAACHLDADPAYACQCAEGGLFGLMAQALQVKPSFRHIRCRRPHIPAPVSKPAGCQGLVAQSEDSLRIREQIIRAFAVFPTLSGSFTEQLYAFPDRGNVY